MLVLVGTSGTGKSSLCAMLEKHGIGRRSVSHTTRDLRPGEEEGRDYFFVSNERFQKLMDEGDLLEWAKVHGQMYGTSSSWLEKTLAAGETVLLDIDIQGAIQVQEKYPEARVVFILPPDFEALKERLLLRDREGKKEIQRRLRHGLEELQMADRFDYLLVNEDLEASCREIEGIARDCLAGAEDDGDSARLLTRNNRELAQKWLDFAKDGLKSQDG